MKINDFIDATILDPAADFYEIESLCQFAKEHQIKAVCIQPCYIELCKHLLQKSKVKIATVVSFPNGLDDLSSKLTQIQHAINSGADEIDFVINRALLANKDFDNLYVETKIIIGFIRDNKKISKWITESPILDDKRLGNVLQIANELKPDFFKTSTGVYSKASLGHVESIYEDLNPKVQIKASGGIKTYRDALAMIEAGAQRIGTSNYREIIERIIE